MVSDKTLQTCFREAMGMMAVVLVNVLAFVYDSEWINIAVGLDIAVAGVMMGVKFAGGGLTSGGPK